MLDLTVLCRRVLPEPDLLEQVENLVDGAQLDCSGEEVFVDDEDVLAVGAPLARPRRPAQLEVSRVVSGRGAAVDDPVHRFSHSIGFGSLQTYPFLGAHPLKK